VVASVVVPAPDYVRFATHYRFRPDFCHAAIPESNGIVENLVGYAKVDLLVPLELDDDPWIDGIAGLNARAQAWCGEVNDRRHSEIHAIPAERLATEVEVLAELPSLRLEGGPKPITRKVDKLSCIRFGSARYSVPNRLIGTTVTVLVDERDRVLRVIEPVTGGVHAAHRLVAPGEVSIDDAHYDRPRPDTPRRVRVRGRRPSGSSWPWARSPSSSLPALPRPGSPSWAPRSPRSSPGVRHTAPSHCWPPWKQLWRSGGGEPTTSGRSWPPTATHPAPQPPVRRWR
jgi:hypothetical protein